LRAWCTCLPPALHSPPRARKSLSPNAAPCPPPLKRTHTRTSLAVKRSVKHTVKHNDRLAAASGSTWWTTTSCPPAGPSACASSHSLPTSRGRCVLFLCDVACVSWCACACACVRARVNLCMCMCKLVLFLLLVRRCCLATITTHHNTTARAHQKPHAHQTHAARRWRRRWVCPPRTSATGRGTRAKTTRGGPCTGYRRPTSRAPCWTCASTACRRQG
jgi:hypothetical protein